ncbi:hypothetical protein CC80DRAFT_549333 [Byssothecium circinans]|uniref:Uncharacterized protein n=1 Tax=Byssothecium circinans TaxID=147558 RepID=A0A6A5TVH2_9PLEO|nr:hypothetical protein CC80DRAFT_549333 [Byssothecium circinans]
MEASETEGALQHQRPTLTRSSRTIIYTEKEKRGQSRSRAIAASFSTSFYEAASEAASESARKMHPREPLPGFLLSPASRDRSPQENGSLAASN